MISGVVLQAELAPSVGQSLLSPCSGLNCEDSSIEKVRNWRIRLTSSGVWIQIVGMTKLLRPPLCFKPLLWLFSSIDDLSGEQACFGFVLIEKLKVKCCFSSFSLCRIRGKLNDLVLRKLEASREGPFLKRRNTRGILSSDLPVCRVKENVLKHINLFFFSWDRDSIYNSYKQAVPLIRTGFSSRTLCIPPLLVREGGIKFAEFEHCWSHANSYLTKYTWFLVLNFPIRKKTVDFLTTAFNSYLCVSYCRAKTRADSLLCKHLFRISYTDTSAVCAYLSCDGVGQRGQSMK